MKYSHHIIICVAQPATRSVTHHVIYRRLFFFSCSLQHNKRDAKVQQNMEF